MIDEGQGPATPVALSRALLPMNEGEKAPLSTLVADSHPLMRAGLVALVEKTDFLALSAQVGSGRDAVTANQENEFAFALIGQTLEDFDAIEAAARLLRQRPSLRIVFCYDHLDANEAAELLQCGVSGLIERGASCSEYEQALRAVATGGTYLPASLARNLFVNARPNLTSGAELSEREREVLRLIAQGYANREIAQALGLSVRTVETHRFNLRQKSGASRPRELMRLAQRLGLLDRDEPSETQPEAPRDAFAE